MHTIDRLGLAPRKGTRMPIYPFRVSSLHCLLNTVCPHFLWKMHGTQKPTPRSCSRFSCLTFTLWDRVWLCSPAGLALRHAPASASWVLGLKVCMVLIHSAFPSCLLIILCAWDFGRVYGLYTARTSGSCRLEEGIGFFGVEVTDSCESLCDAGNWT